MGTMRKMMARIVITKEAMTDLLGPQNPPECLAFPGGPFVRVMSREVHGVYSDLIGGAPAWWYDGVHKGPFGQTPRAPGNLPKRLRKAARKESKP